MKILYNANIHTPMHGNATALVIDRGRFAAFGTDTDILNGFPKSTLRYDLQGRTIWPGLTDSHLHLNHLADSLVIVDCETQTMEECLRRIKDTAVALPKSAWIRGHGWNHNHWEAGFGHKEILDKVCDGRPAFLTAKSLHAAWVNSRAFELANITPETSDPSGGLIQRDKNHFPTGILFENAAMNLVKSVIPEQTQHERLVRYQRLFTKLFEVGLVCVHDFDGLDSWNTLQKCQQDELLRLRVRKTIPLEQLEAFIGNGMHTNWGDDKLNIGCVKLFADGALGPQTAAMELPYEGSASKGVLLLTENEIVDIGELATQNGIGLAVHAIGDRANKVVLNALEKLRSFENKHKLPHLNHRIEHVQIINPWDLPRLAKLKITASVQPIHAPSDMEISDAHLGSRSKNAYAFRTMLENNINCVFGSDAPVESFHPFKGIHAAISRQRLDGSPGKDGWHPDQRLSLGETLEGFTINPAKLIQRGAYLGRIAKGYKADFLILNEDPFDLKPHQMANCQPAATFIDGECVFQSSPLSMSFIDGEGK